MSTPIPNASEVGSYLPTFPPGKVPIFHLVSRYPRSRVIPSEARCFRHPCNSLQNLQKGLEHLGVNSPVPFVASRNMQTIHFE